MPLIWYPGRPSTASDLIKRILPRMFYQVGRRSAPINDLEPTMLLLRDFGLPANNPQARKACVLLLDQGLQRDGGVNYGWRGRSETCITGMVLSILAHFEYDDDRLD